MVIGNKSTFAFEIGQHSSETELRTVDIVIGNRYVCRDDNSAYVPQFIASMQCDIERIFDNDWNKYHEYFKRKSINEIHEFILRTRTEGTREYDIEDDSIYPLHKFLDWGPTTDNLCCFIIPINDKHYLTYQFWRPEHPDKSENGTIHNVQIELSEIAEAIKEAIALLKGRCLVNFKVQYFKQRSAWWIIYFFKSATSQT
jgi:hypothetical protein